MSNSKTSLDDPPLHESIDNDIRYQDRQSRDVGPTERTSNEMEEFTSMPSMQQLSHSFFGNGGGKSSRRDDEEGLRTPLTPSEARPVEEVDLEHVGKRLRTGGGSVKAVERDLKSHPLHAVPTPLALLHQGAAREGVNDGGGYNEKDVDNVLRVGSGGEAEDVDCEGILNRFERFVLQWDITHYGMALGFAAYTVMMRSLANKFDNIQFFETMWLILWYLSVGIGVGISTVYAVRCVMFFQACLADFNDHRLVNFFFAPLIVAASLALSTPDKFLPGDKGEDVVGFHVAFWVLLIGQMAGALWLYGDWLFGGKRIVGEIHPLFFMTVIGWFLVANIGGRIREIDAAQFAFVVGSLFWLIVFVTTFQHLSHTFREKLQKPQPTMFLFIAPPAAAALAWISIERGQGIEETSLEFMSSFFLYIDMFLYLLVLRLFPLFWTHPFGVVWWAYIFPLSTAASTIVWFSTSRKTTFWTTIAAGSAIVSTLAYLIVISLSLWALWKGKVPHNPGAIKRYCMGMRKKKQREALHGFESA